MKWFVILLICAGLGYAGYRYRDQLKDVFGKSASGSGTTSGTAKPTPPEPVGPRPDPPKPVKKPEIDPDIAEKFPLPQFKSLEELVGNWQNIPASAFPRVVTVNKAVKVSLPGAVGSTSLEANKPATAIGIAGDQLTVIRVAYKDEALFVSPTSARGSIPIDETDFKQVLGDIYDAWKKRKTNQVLAARKNAMREREEGTLASNDATSSPPSSDVITPVPEPKSIDPKVGPRPAQESNGKVPVMISSITAGDVNEIKVDEIEGWGPVRYEVVDDEPYWTGTVNYKTTTLFGVIDTEAMALIRKGKVVNWVYTGSGEEVP